MKKIFTKQHRDRISTSNKGKHRSEETKEKIRKNHKGSLGKHWKLSKKHKENISKGLIKRAFRHTDEAKLKMSLAQKGNTKWLGKKHSEKTKEKMRKSPNSGKFKKGFISPMKGKKSIYAGELHPMYGIKRSLETRKKISNTRIKKQIGRKENNGNWKGGITNLKVTIRSSLEYAKNRKETFMRDWYTCQECGDSTGGNLEMHHLKPFSVIFKENNLKTFTDALNCCELWDINNCVTLCHKCHKKTDSYGNKRFKISVPTLELCLNK